MVSIPSRYRCSKCGVTHRVNVTRPKLYMTHLDYAIMVDDVAQQDNVEQE